MDLPTLLNELKQFREERDWKQFHLPKSLAMALSVEASEVMALFLWCTNEESNEIAKQKRGELSEELADVAMYLFYLADSADIDLLAAMKDKMEKNAKKYPVEKAKGNSRKYTEL